MCFLKNVFAPFLGDSMVQKNDECCQGSKGPFEALIPLLVILIIGLAGIYAIGTSLKGAPSETKIGDISISQNEQHSLQVTGEAAKKVAPDQFGFSLSVETLEQTTSAAAQKNAEKINEIKRALLANGVREQEIETSYYTVQKETKGRWVCPKENPGCEQYDKEWVEEFIGYKAVQTVTLSTSQLEKGGELVDAALNAGATNVDNIHFSLKKETRKAIEDELVASAGQNAKKQAQELASSLNVQLGKPISITKTVVYPYENKYNRNVFAEGLAGAMDSGTEFSSGVEEVSVNVYVTYEVS